MSLVRVEGHGRHGAGVVLGALAAGVAFGAFFVVLAHTGDDAGLWPLVGARPASIALAAVVARRARTGILVPRGVRGVATAAGVLDMGANALFLLASTQAQLALVGVLAALYPAPTVLLARVLGRERLRPVQWCGLAFAAVALALIALR